MWFMATTDNGPNELWSKKAIQVLTRDLDHFFFLPHNCLEHQAHLGVLGSLKLCDNMLRGRRQWKYFSSAAIIATTLRDLSQALFAAWRALFGEDSAVASVKKLFPRCVSGRWGSIDVTEARMLEATLGRLAKAFKFMTEAAPALLQENGAGNTANPDNCVDTLSLEASKEFSIRMGKWRLHTWRTLQDNLFHRVVAVMHTTRKPWIHLSNFLKKKLNTDSSYQGANHLEVLVCGKAQNLGNDFEEMLFGACLSWRNG